MNAEMVMMMQSIGILMAVFFVGQYIVFRLAMLSLHKRIRKIVSDEIAVLYYLLIDESDE
ncbi:hypothetical protein WN865_01195 [Tetragenococcus halophilus]